MTDLIDANVADDQPKGRPSHRVPPSKWMKENLFPNWWSSAITIILGVLIIFLGYRALNFVFNTARWDPIRSNMELFMIGQFPREERWRIVSQLIVAAGGVGMGIGSMRASNRDRAVETGEPFEPTPPRVLFASYWAASLFLLASLITFARTPGPWIVVGCAIAAAIVGRFITVGLPRRMRLVGWTLAALAMVVQLQLLTGTGGWAWFYTTVALLPLVTSELTDLSERNSRVGDVLGVAGAAIGIGALIVNRDLFAIIAAGIGLVALLNVIRRDGRTAAQIGAIMVVGFAVSWIYQWIGLSGIDWADWGGFHLNVVTTVAAILMAFPLGVLLALGRRSQLPALRALSVAYIELFRGVPLITLLLAAQFFLGFFLNTDSPLSLITRAIVVITIFSAAYIAEIIRGGLAAVDKGQIEAGQASGLQQITIMRLIVMPQALRAVIPAMVGQFISLWKDTTLLSILSIREFLEVRGLVHTQEAFRGFGIAETLVYVAFGFWAIAFTMSRESQRLEKRLGVGER